MKTLNFLALLSIAALILLPGLALAEDPPQGQDQGQPEGKDKDKDQPPPPQNWKPAGEVTQPPQPVEPGAKDQPLQDPGKPSDQPVPPPEGWKPAGEVSEPGATAGAAAKPIIPDPLFKYGSFELSVHGLVQVLAGVVGGDAAIDNGDLLNRDGFRALRTRVGLSGKILDHWEYAIEAELFDRSSGGNGLLEAKVTYRPADFAFVTVGAGKSPFSRTLLASSKALQFIDRPLWVAQERATQTLMLDLDRQIGLTVGGSLSYFSLSAGVYNGTPNFSMGNLHHGLLYVVRLDGGMGDLGVGEADHQRTGPRWKVGLNGYINDAAADQIRGAGIDGSLKLWGISFYAEAVWAKSVPASRPELVGSSTGETERWGMAAQAGYLLPLSFAELELAIRFAIMDDNVHIDDEGDQWELTAGVNAYFYGENVKLMINYVLREELHGTSLSNDGVFAMLQLRF
jgi:hypothetical protein